MSEHVVLCNDCLRIAPYSEARHAGDEMCICGGEFCGCGSCVDTAARLVAGERRADQLGVIADVGYWSADQGIHPI